MTKDTITVWVMEHDDADVKYVVNARADMESNFDNLLNEVNRIVSIRTMPGTGGWYDYDASTVLKRTDPVVWDTEFMRYCQTWTEIEMPLDVYLSDDENARIDWLTARV